MPAQTLELTAALTSIAEAMLIGLLVGVQRESRGEERHAGVRDFLIIALTGGVCGVAGSAWLTAAALLAIVALLIVFYLRAPERTGITTEMAAVATFCLGYVTAAPGLAHGATIAIGTTLLVVAFLEARKGIHTFIHERMTESEFNNTLGFLAVIFVIYPVLPDGAYGPYRFFEPRKVWMFVILVSSISYIGYFLQKFLGPQRGLQFTSVLGGLASTTAATTAFAHDAADDPACLSSYWRAAVVANAVQFPRVLAILWVLNGDLARALAIALLAAAASGLVLGWLLGRRYGPVMENRLNLGNPFRLLPALQFGALFSGILFFTKAAAAELGSEAVLWTSAVAGSVDVDAVVASMSDLAGAGKVDVNLAGTAVMLALGMNAVLKSAVAAWIGRPAFGLRVAVGFAVMFVCGTAAWWAARV